MSLTEKPLVSIIIPTFNRRDYCKLAIESALGQTWQPKEVIVVDDGSSDGTLDLLREMSRTLPEKDFRFLSQTNRGQHAARNEGLKVANGELIRFLDSDDTLEPNALEEQIVELRATGADLCICAKRYMSPEGRKWNVNYKPLRGIVVDPISDFFNLKLRPTTSLWLFRASLFQSHTWDESLVTRGDTDLVGRMIIDGALVCGAPSAIYNQRYHSSTRENQKQFQPEVLEGTLRFNQRHLSLMRANKVSWGARRALSRSLSRTALRAWDSDRGLAIAFSRLARRAFPFPELVLVKTYPAARVTRIAAYTFWLIGGVRLCGPLWYWWRRAKSNQH